MKFILMIFLLGCSTPSQESTIKKDPLALATALIEAARYEKPYQDIRKDLANLDFDYLHKFLDTDNKKLAFWINIYNANVQLLLKENPELFDNRGSFFSNPRMTIAGKELSFDDIEHGIIRRSQGKLTLGFLPKLFISKYERKMRTKERDGRIHFALNCGAKSCPPVGIYDAARIDKQLDKSSKKFLKKNSKYKKRENKVYTTTLFSWFRGDFGGLDGAKDYLRRYKIIDEEDDPSLSFTTYDWTLSLGNFIDL